MSRFMIYLFIILLLLWIGIPIYWVLKTSFSPETEVWERGLPTSPTLQNYIDVLSPIPPKGKIAEVVGIYAALNVPALTPLINSLRVAILTVLLTLLASISTAYNLARFSYRGKRFVVKIHKGHSMDYPVLPLLLKRCSFFLFQKYLNLLCQKCLS